jgi:uncharacterized membrane protein YdjX (TVP38/TMEM64 family)
MAIVDSALQMLPEAVAFGKPGSLLWPTWQMADPTSRRPLERRAARRAAVAAAHNRPMSRPARLLLVLAFFALLLAIVELTGLRAHLDLAYVRAQFTGHVVQGLAIFALLFSVGNLIQVPGWIFLAAAVLALGRTWGGLATLVAAMVSTCVSFWLLRALGGDALRGLDGRFARRIFGQLDAHPVRSVALLRFVLGTAPPLNVALALSGVRFRHYLLGTAIGLPFPVAFFTVFFDTAGRLLRWNLPA